MADRQPRKAASRRGRPPQTSREQIVETAVALAEREPDAPLSLHRLARALGLTPMALYGHFADKDALLQAVAARLLATLAPALSENAAWDDQLRTWAQAVRRHFLRYPMLFGLLGWRHHVASAWLGQVAMLARILQRAGFDDTELAGAVQWASKTITGAIYTEIASRQAGSSISEADLRELPPADAELVGELLSHLGRQPAGTEFDACVDRVIDALRCDSSA